MARALRDAKRPLMYVGDGVWKSGAIAEVTALAERFGVPVVGDPRAVSIKHPLHAGGRRLEQAPDIDPDLILCIGVTHNGAGNASDYTAFFDAERTIAIGADAENLENIPGLDLAVLADEKRAAQALLDATDGSSDDLSDRRSRAREEVAALRAQRRDAAWRVPAEQGKVRAVALGDALDQALESRGGGLVTIEQFAVAQDILANNDEAGRNQYIRPAGGSEGYGVGMAIGAKLGAPDTPVVGLVGDGSLYYSDHALWTAASHGVPVLYVISNNGAYGIVASSFANAKCQHARDRRVPGRGAGRHRPGETGRRLWRRGDGRDGRGQHRRRHRARARCRGAGEAAVPVERSPAPGPAGGRASRGDLQHERGAWLVWKDGREISRPSPFGSEQCRGPSALE